MKWNTEEYVVGCVFGASLFMFLKWFTLIVAPLAGLLWMLGGQYGEYWRKIGIPALLCGSLALVCHHWLPLVSSPLVFGVTCIGYGIPSFANGTMDDKGSALGNFVYFKIIDDNNLATIITRGIVGLAMMTAFLPLAWVGIVGYLVAGGIMVVGFPMVVVLVP